MRYEVGSTGIVIEVPVGFVTDYASIPRALWSLYSPHDQYSRAAVVHDYLYWSQLCSRTQADNLFMIAMRESEVAETTRNNVYAGVRTLGEPSWERNRRERDANKPKVVPPERTNFPPNWSWEMYRDYLITMGVKDPEFRGDDYCVLGNSTEVPTLSRDSPNARTLPKLATRAREGMDRDLFMRGPDWTPQQELRRFPRF
jgi:hypothetical protein